MGCTLYTMGVGEGVAAESNVTKVQATYELPYNQLHELEETAL